MDEALDKLRKAVKEVSEDKITETFSKGALKMDGKQIQTVSFVFWLCYMAETDLNDIIQQAWDMAQKATQFPNQDEVNKVIKDMGFDFENLEYFSQKIGVYDKMFGKTARTKLLWKINDIRNDLSHNRIADLKYEGASLAEREIKEKIIIDYFETSFTQDRSKSKIWNSMTAEQQAKIEQISTDFINRISDSKQI
jgi:hypothetical protein